LAIENLNQREEEKDGEHLERERVTERERQTDRQTDRKTNRQLEYVIHRQTNIHNVRIRKRKRERGKAG